MSAARRISRLALIGLVVGSGVLAVLHVARVVARLSFDYDLLLWGDDYFMTSMAKLAAGVPIYGPIEDANSTVYSPGGPWLHHLLLGPFGAETSLLGNRLLNLTWLAGGVSLSAFAAVHVARLIHGRPPEPVDRLLSVALAFFVLAVAALTNPVVDSLHPTDLELLTLGAALATLACWGELGKWTRLVLCLVLPAAGVLAKQTGGLAVTAALTGARLLDREVPLPRRLLGAAAPVAALAVTLGALVVGTQGGFRRWGFDVLTHHPFDWWKVTDLYSGYFLLFSPSLALVVAASVVLSRRRDVGAHAFRRVCLLPLAYALPSLAALFKRFGGPNNLAVLGFLLVAVALPVLLGFVPTERAPLFPGAAPFVPVLLSVVVAAQVALFHPRRRVPSPSDRDNAALICDYAVQRLRCGERVHLGRGSVCLARGGVRVPIDRLNSITELVEAGRGRELGFFRRISSEDYDVLEIPMTDLMYLGQDFWSAFHQRYVAFFQTQGALENDFWFDGWQGYVSWPVVFFERRRDHDGPRRHPSPRAGAVGCLRPDGPP